MRILAALAVVLALGACGGPEEVGTSPDVTRAAAYVHEGPATLTLLTVISNETGSGAHTGLMVNGSQRVMWDPAGTYNDGRVMPERGDVLYGMDPGHYQSYVDYHTRPRYRTIEQTVQVSPEVAERVLAMVQSHGAASKATCARSTSTILSQVPGFESVGTTWFPKDLMERFARVPGVQTRTYRDETEAPGDLIVTAGLDA